MTRQKSIAGLQRLADMVLDARLSELRKAATLRQASIEKLEGLRAPPPQLGDGQGIAEAMSALQFQSWAEVRRADISQTLAKQTANWLDARSSAAQAFGKARGFEKLALRMAQKRKLD
jgi:hypothetical protein